MSRRQTLADANQARDIRRLQERAALHRLRLQQLALAEAREELERRIEIQAESEAEWLVALGQPFVDVGAIGLWRLNTDVARARVVAGEQAVATGDDAFEARRQAWTTQLRLAEAVESVAIAAARNVRRAADERALQTAEGVLHSRRVQV